jgi:hypothetical protein
MMNQRDDLAIIEDKAMKGPESKVKNQTKILIILILASVAGAIYLISLFWAYPVFQNTRLADPLAEIHSLSPLYYLAIALTALLGLGCFLWRLGNKYLHLLLLMMLALMLWFTPYYLAGFTRLPDGLWHVGAALKMPQVLDGEPVAFSRYAWSFPGSYIYHYSFIRLVDIQPLTYINLYPLFCLFLFVLLCYVLLAKLLSPRAALLSLLLAIPGLHYLQLHPSPHTIGVLLMLTALVLLLRQGLAAKVIGVVVILVTIISHSTAPLLLCIFLGAALVTSLVYSGKITRLQVAIACILIICFIGWIYWYFFYPAPPTAEVVAPEETSSLAQEISPPQTSPWLQAADWHLQLIPEDLEVAPEYLLGAPFIYENIYNLNKAIYFLYAAAGILGILYIVARTYSEKRSLRKWIVERGGLQQSQTLMIVSLLVLLPFTFLLAEKAHDLIETGLTFMILAISCLIASVVTRLHRPTKRIVPSFLIVSVLFLTLCFPIVAYSIDAYSSVPESEGVGLQFLARHIPLEGKTILMSGASELGLYLESPLNKTEFISLIHPRDNSSIKPDIVVFRSTGCYYAAMRYDLSFEDNRCTKYRDFANSHNYDKVYWNPAFEVYSMHKEE